MKELPNKNKFYEILKTKNTKLINDYIKGLSAFEKEWLYNTLVTGLVCAYLIDTDAIFKINKYLNENEIELSKKQHLTELTF